MEMDFLVDVWQAYLLERVFKPREDKQENKTDIYDNFTFNLSAVGPRTADVVYLAVAFKEGSCPGNV
jgi:hypothetical protein